MAVYKQKGVEEADKAAALEAATLDAARVPAQVAALSLEAAQLAQRIAAVGNVNAVTDAAAAALMARAAVQTAALNVKINAAGLQNKSTAQALIAEITALEKEMEGLATAVATTAAERGGF